MFDFQKLSVYTKAKEFNNELFQYFEKVAVDRITQDQFRRAALSIMLNVAEGAGRNTAKDKKHFYVISRGSAFECVACLDFLKDRKKVSDEIYKEFFKMLEEISKMLMGLIKYHNNLTNKKN